MPIHIIVADDHPLFRSALTSLLVRLTPDIVINETSSFTELTDLLSEKVLHPDLLLLDLKLPDINGMEGLLNLKKRYADLPVAVISAYDDKNIIRQTRQYGASGFIPKSLDLDEMAAAIRKVLDGDLFFPHCEDSDCDERLLQGFQELTSVQLRVLKLLKDGKPSKSMAATMGVTEATIKAHLTTIFRKLGVRNRTQAVIAANQLELPEQLQE